MRSKKLEMGVCYKKLLEATSKTKPMLTINSCICESEALGDVFVFQCMKSVFGESANFPPPEMVSGKFLTGGTSSRP